ncbi:MAG: YicC/YloC family endoribonuclease [Rhabdochlamydiaceae bacterium]
MTAYGQAVLQTKRARWTLEISSVNRKSLDIHLHLPHFLLFLDPILRKWVGQITERGNLTIRISCEMKEVSNLIQQLKNEKKRWEEVAAALNLSQDQITLPFLLGQITPQEAALDQEVFEKEIVQAWKKASKAWITMKEQEGKALTHDIQLRLKIISQEMKKIEKELPKVIKGHLMKLSERMEELKLTCDLQQLKNEAALQADRDDVTEEIIRLKSHMEQMILYLKSTEKSVGKTLDFLAQEMGREIGTLMAKAGSSTIAKCAVKIKSEIEKIREQVQNIE